MAGVSHSDMTQFLYIFEEGLIWIGIFLLISSPVIFSYIYARIFHTNINKTSILGSVAGSTSLIALSLYIYLYGELGEYIAPYLLTIGLSTIWATYAALYFLNYYFKTRNLTNQALQPTTCHADLK